MRKIITPTAIAAILLFTVHFNPSVLNAQAGVSVAFQSRITGLSSPMEVHTAPGDLTNRLFIVEKAGVIRIWNGTSLLPTPFLDISSLVVDNDERGLLSMAFHPQYQANGFFFVYYNDNSGNLTISRYQVSGDPNVANNTANPITPLVSISKPFENHNGGHIQFKPAGGINYLYFATGDGGSGNDPNNNSQNPNSRLGKMIRINADNTTPTLEVMAWGLRNPFRWSFDKLTGDVWIGDVGQDNREEVSFRASGASGANYGWPCREGTRDNSASAPSGLDCDTVDNVYVHPVFEYLNPPCCATSVFGGYRYRGSAYPQFQGYYMATDYFDGRVWFIRSNGSGGWITSAPQTALPANISSFSETDNGDTIYAVANTGNSIYKLIPTVVTPVSLISFSGITSPGYNDLKWSTVYEENIDRYIIEFSTDGRNYSEAGTVASVNRPDLHTYIFRHVIVMPGKIFYRLRITELDGSYNYSPAITLGSKEKTGVEVYPTFITSGMVNIVAASPVEKIEIININGQKVVSKNMSNVTGFFRIPLPLASKGVYYMQVAGKDFHQTEKIIVQ
jgi:glucose/arabinose dehydrogenase